MKKQAVSAKLDGLYADGGRPSIPPERLLTAQLLIAFYSVRSDRQFCEQLDYNLLFRWLLNLPLESGGPTSGSKCFPLVEAMSCMGRAIVSS